MSRQSRPFRTTISLSPEDEAAVREVADANRLGVVDAIRMLMAKQLDLESIKAFRLARRVRRRLASDTEGAVGDGLRGSSTTGPALPANDTP